MAKINLQIPGLLVLVTILFAGVILVSFAWNNPAGLPSGEPPPTGTAAGGITSAFEAGGTRRNLGIGITNPLYNLDVNAGGALNNGFRTTGYAKVDKLVVGKPVPSDPSRLHIVDGSLLQNNPITAVLPIVGGSSFAPGSKPMPAAIPSRVKVAGKYAYVTFQGSGPDAFRIIDVSNPALPAVVGGNLMSGLPAAPIIAVDVAVAGRYAYVTFSGTGADALRIIDVSNPANPLVVGTGPTANMPSATGLAIAVAGNYAYVNFTGACNNAFRIIDVSNKAVPIVVGGNTGSGFMPPCSGAGKLPNKLAAMGIAVTGRYVYVNFAGSQGEAFRIIDTSTNPPTVVGGWSLVSMPVNDAPTDLQVYGRFAYLTFDGPDNAILRVVDVSNPDDPQVTGSLQYLSSYALSAAGRYVYIGGISSFLAAVDVGDPTAPVFTGSNTTFTSSIRGVAVAGRYAYLTLASTGNNAFRIVDITGIEGVSGSFQSLETGSLQVRENMLVDNNLTVKSGLNVGGHALISGKISKGGGNFLIDHPLDPLNKVLRHSFVESPDMKNIYDGIAVLDQKGESTIQLPDYFESLNKDFRYQVTPIGSPAPNLFVRKVEDNIFLITGGNPYQKVSWQITGIRKDPYAEKNPIIVEEEKKTPGYIHPELYE